MSHSVDNPHPIPDHEPATEDTCHRISVALDNMEVLVQKPGQTTTSFKKRLTDFTLPNGSVLERAFVTVDAMFPARFSSSADANEPADPFAGSYRMLSFEAIDQARAVALEGVKERAQEVFRASGYADPDREMDEQGTALAESLLNLEREIKNTMAIDYHAVMMECDGTLVELLVVPRSETEFHILGTELLTNGTSERTQPYVQPVSELIASQLADHLESDIFGLSKDLPGAA